MLLQRLQKTLGLARYKFGVRAMPDLLRNRGWGPQFQASMDLVHSQGYSHWVESLHSFVPRFSSTDSLADSLSSIMAIYLLSTFTPHYLKVSISA